MTTHPASGTNLVTSYTLDGNGNTLTRTTADSVVATHTYDNLSRLTQVAATSLSTISYAYDELSRRTSMTDGTGTTTYSYDRMSRLTQAAQPNGTVSYAYDLDSNRTTLTYPGSLAVTYTFSNAGRLSSLLDWGSRYGWADAGNERWIGLDDPEDGPHLTRAHAALQPDRKHFWFPTELDGPDTYRRGHGPLEVGVVEKFELSKRDTDKRRIVGDFIEVTGTEYRDVIVTLEPHPVASLRHVRVVRMRTPTPSEPRKATASAVRAYMDRCAERNLVPSGWVNHLPTNWWQGMDVGLLKRLAESGGPDAADAADELRRQNY